MLELYFIFFSPWMFAENEREDDIEGELCNVVITVLFTIMWKGYDLHDKSAWKVSQIYEFRT